MVHYIVKGKGQRKAGIVASSYKEFLKKCKVKFGYKKDEDITVCLEDDTEVDEEYFEVVKAGTHLYLRTSDDDGNPPDTLHHLATFLQACLKKEPSLHSRVMKCLHEPLTSEHATSLLKLLAMTASGAACLSDKSSDAGWFQGLDTKFRTKEAVMRNSAESRMRGYLYHTRHELLADTPTDHPHIAKAILFFKEQLRNCGYNSSYFDRTAGEKDCLCDMRGLFQCWGPYNRSSCAALHFINPYASRESRIVFSTWNLDHVIEKSRTVIPSLKAALQGRRASSVNLQYFHQLLFQHQSGIVGESEVHDSSGDVHDGNLKLVHIACHDKKPHNLELQDKDIYLSRDIVDGKRNKASHKIPDLILVNKDTYLSWSEVDKEQDKAVIKKLHSHKLQNKDNYPTLDLANGRPTEKPPALQQKASVTYQPKDLVDRRKTRPVPRQQSQPLRYKRRDTDWTSHYQTRSKKLKVNSTRER